MGAWASALSRAAFRFPLAAAVGGGCELSLAFGPRSSSPALRRCPGKVRRTRAENCQLGSLGRSEFGIGNVPFRLLRKGAEVEFSGLGSLSPARVSCSCSLLPVYCHPCNKRIGWFFWPSRNAHSRRRKNVNGFVTGCDNPFQFCGSVESVSPGVLLETRRLGSLLAFTTPLCSARSQ
ncbi:uncharacterized protein B0H64DRAFT_211988 [Chaetomium fimeti]|uniref:Secreted protein n=1 Tax=Chaetomium fimeti TaxID=1854472 RepID=A0AAE0HBE8_9PEZI|nr:hypothetical protein B0H64DRAFT_211988 [Chaetomium fimeti]